MATRKKQSTARTLLCATKFWSHCFSSGSSLDPIFNDPKKPCTPTLRRGVRHVVQGIRGSGRYGTRPSPAEIDRAEKLLIKQGFLRRSGNTLQVTEKGRKASCKTTDLSPWTDSQYPGSALSGCGCSSKRKR
jgi:hypothetical protein